MSNPETLAELNERQDASNLQDNVDRQQAKITELKELVRKSEAAHGSSTSSAQEKVKNIAQRLTQMRSKARSRQKIDTSLDEVKDADIFEETPAGSPIPSCQTIRAETPGSEKIQLLRRQVEESKMKMAEREINKREIEERVIQLKAKFDSAQQSLERSSELGRSMGDLSALNANTIKEKFKSSVDLSFAPLNLDKEKIKFLENRIKILEKQIEKQINAPPTSESEAVNFLRNQILDLEENLRAKEKIIDAKTQAVNLVSENLSAKTATSLGNLEDTRVEMQKMQEKFIESEKIMQEDIEKLQNQLEDRNGRIRNLEEMNDILETARFELTVKNADLENKLQGFHEHSSQLNELNTLNDALQVKINDLEEQLTEKTVECNVLAANFSVLQEKLKSTAPKSLFSKTGDEKAEIEIHRLKEQLEESNKSTIKIKLRCKQLQKQVDKFEKMSDAHSEAIRLTKETQELQERISELTKENANIQLNSSGTFGQANKCELENKIKVLEITCQNQTAAIKLLEEQKLELQSPDQIVEPSLKQQKEEKGTSTEVASRMDSIELEGQAQEFISVFDKLSSDLEKLRYENESLRQEICTLEDEKRELQKKTDHYIAENIELIDKVEELSKSSSSAESIEIVERLTQQEKLEMEGFNKNMSSAEESRTEFVHSKQKVDETAEVLMGQELSESLTKLREESSELMHRIELFTRERREVLEKMEILSSENQKLTNEISNLEAEKSTICDNLTKSKLEIVSLEEQLEKSLEKITELETSLEDSLNIKLQLENEIKCLKDATQQSLSLCPETIAQCKGGLTLMQTELENYRKSNDKSSRLNASKKLAKEAKNVSQQFSDLLENVTKRSSAERTSNINIELEELKEKCLELETITKHLKEELLDSKRVAEEKDLEIVKLSTTFNLTLENIEKSQLADHQELSALKTIRQELEAKLNATDEEMKILNDLVSEQKQLLTEIHTEHEIELNMKDADIQKYKLHVERLDSELNDLRTQNRKSHDEFNTELRRELKKMENKINTNEMLIAEQSSELKNKQDTIVTLNAQIMDLYKAMEENSCKLSEKEDEISYLQELLDTNKVELEALTKDNESNKKAAERLSNDMREGKTNAEYEVMIADSIEKSKQSEAIVKALERKNAELETKNKEHVDKLKKFAANLKKKTALCAQLETKLEAVCLESSSHPALQQQIEHLEKEIITLKDEQLSTLERNKSLSLEYTKMRNEVGIYKTKMKYFADSISEVEHLVDRLHQNMTEKEHELQQLQEQLDFSRSAIEEYQVHVNTANDELRSKNLKFEKSKAVIKEKNREIQRLAVELDDVKKELMSHHKELEHCGGQNSNFQLLQEEHDRVLAAQQIEKEHLEEKINHLEMLYNGTQAKIQENIGYIETLETENNIYKNKIVKLENCIASFEERRQSLERKTDILDAKLQKQTDEYERNEDALLYRLNMLLDHDDVIGKRLIETQEKKEELVEKIQQCQIENSELQLKLCNAGTELENFKKKKFKEILVENENLQQQLKNTQVEFIRQQNIYEGRLAQKHAEIDELENDLSIQLNKINQEKRKLQEALEKSQDEVIDMKDENVKLKENGNSLEQTKNDLERELTWLRMQNENMTQDQCELQELRIQTIQDKTELDNLKHQMDSLMHTQEAELNMLRQQIKELDSIRMQVGQNQTDDQVFIENENKRLTDQLVEKEIIIENYQRENLKLKMTSTSTGINTYTDPFPCTSQIIDLSVPEISGPTIATLNEKIKCLEEEVAKLTTLISEKDQLCNDISLEAELAKEKLEDMQQETSKLRTKCEHLQKLTENGIDATLSNSFLSNAPDTVFEELLEVRRTLPLENTADTSNLKKIEDLERKVADLEKHANELESKLTSLNYTHQNTLLQLQEQTRQHDETVNKYKEQLNQIEMLQKEKEIQKNVEAMIVPNEAMNITPPSLDIFFSTPQQSISESFDIGNESNSIPVQEELIVAKKAYLLHPEGCIPPSMVEDEGWSFGMDEAILEERHQHELSLLNPKRDVELLDCKNHVSELILEKNRSDEKIIELQVKCGKLMRKLKEYKCQLEKIDTEKNSRKSSSFDPCDLDMTIQDELKSQMQKLEEHIVDMRKQNEKDLAEKENLIKKIEVLTNSNERLTEMKKNQEVTIEGLQAEIRQLAQKLQRMENFSETEEKNRQQINNATSSNEISNHNKSSETLLEDALKELKDLGIERDELQALLEDEKHNVLLSEVKIKELKEKSIALENFSVISDADQRRISNLEDELKKLQDLLSHKEAELHESNVRNQNFQLQLNDYQATIKQLSSEMDCIKSNFEKLQQKYAECMSENTHISEEIKTWMDKNEALSNELETWKTRTQLSMESAGISTMLEEKVSDLTSQLQYKEAEIFHLKQKVQDLIQNDQTEQLMQEIATNNQEIVQLHMRLQQVESNQTLEHADVDTSDSDTLRKKVIQLESKLNDFQKEKDAYLHELTSLENQDRTKDMVLELSARNIEIAELKSTVALLSQQNAKLEESKSMSLSEHDEQVKIDEMNSSWERIVEQKCTEIAESWRQYLDQRETEFKKIESELNLEVEQLRAGILVPKRKISEQSETIEPETLANMQTVLEQQELEIVTLQEQLALRSAEYARLAARHDPYALSTSSNVSIETKTQTKQPSGSITAFGSDQSAVVPKSELDLALYMLHQRGMRCEELTLELVNLLEERDTLQLKLSNSLRQIEEIKQKSSNPESASDTDQVSSNTNTPEKSSKDMISATDDNLKNNLSSKLSQLQTVGYSKDKRIKEDRDERQWQMEKIQQDVANIPGEAVSELVGSNLANTMQSPSNVLLDWLWGKNSKSQQS